jgi:hypothetical protein
MLAYCLVNVVSDEVGLRPIRRHTTLLGLNERRHVSVSHSFSVSIRYNARHEIKTLHKGVDHLIGAIHHIA